MMDKNSTARSLVPGVAAAWDLSDVDDFTKAWEVAKPVGTCIQETEEDDEEAIKKKAALAEAARVKAVADAEESKKQVAKAAACSVLVDTKPHRDTV
jgi:tRNA(Ser,Leu) C12 N-acetylase TAN1